MAVAQKTKFCKTTPCANCPYRKDAPLALWSVDEFKALLASDKDYIGKVYQCHKKDGNVCVGWLMNQEKRRLPSIALRLSLSKNNVTAEYLDQLHCNTPMFDTVEEMCRANFPEDFK